MRAPRYSAFNISTRCRSPTESVPMRVGRDRQAEASGHLQQLCAGAAAAGKWPPERLAPEHHVIKHAQVVGQREVLVHHADAGVRARCVGCLAAAAGQTLRCRRCRRR